jgi:hypothetical protein
LDRAIRRVVGQYGYEVPGLCTPEELMGEDHRAVVQPGHGPGIDCIEQHPRFILLLGLFGVRYEGACDNRLANSH